MMKRILLAWLLLMWPLFQWLPNTHLQANPQYIFSGYNKGSSSVSWTLIQHPNNFTCGTSGTGSTQIFSCTVNLTSTTVAGNVLLMLASFSSGTDTVAPSYSSASDNGAAETWVHCPAQFESNSASSVYANTDCAYILSAAGGATTATFAWTATVATSGGGGTDVELLELHHSSGTAAFDAPTSGSSSIATCSGTCATVSSPTFTITGPSDYVAQWISWGDTISSISGAAYVNPFDVDNSNVDGAFAGALNQSSAPAQTWTLTGGGSASLAALSGVAFKAQ